MLPVVSKGQRVVDLVASSGELSDCNQLYTPHVTLPFPSV